jgi:putative membrane protein
MKQLTALLRPAAMTLALGLTALSAHAATPAGFVDDASAKGLAEIQTSQLALEKSQAADVKKFAQMMIDDHTAANEELAEVATTLELEVADEAELMARAKKMILEYREESFDKAYADNQVVAHEQTIKLFQDEIKSSTSPELKTFAEKTLPKLEQHLQEAKDLQARHQ